MKLPVDCLLLSLVLLSMLKAVSAAETAAAIPFAQLGSEADKKGGSTASSITPTATGARLKALMQDLEGEATPEGLWLTSTADEDVGKVNRFRVKAAAFGHSSSVVMPSTGTVHASQQSVLWLRPGLIEEYSVSSDGVRQDFVLMQRPAGVGSEIAMDLEITGARVESADYGVKLTVTATGRELAYSRLKVTDATGKELSARFDIVNPERLRITVQDAGAVYPVRIDPTFSDADWVALNTSIAGANGDVSSIALDGSGNLYVGGTFTGIGTVAANRIAKWTGSAWSALGSGVAGGNFATVEALAVIGSDLYAGGNFTTAGGTSANSIAKWNGSEWSALGSGFNYWVKALAVIGTDLYVGGSFPGGIAKWNGSSWSAVGILGADNAVSALAVSGSDLYAGGSFTGVGGISANRIAKWNGSVWSALGSGMNGSVYALAVSGSDLYAGGGFTTAGGMSANRIAKWNGSAWSALGSGMDNDVHALAVSGGLLYAGGGGLHGGRDECEPHREMERQHLERPGLWSEWRPCLCPGSEWGRYLRRGIFQHGGRDERETRREMEWQCLERSGLRHGRRPVLYFCSNAGGDRERSLCRGELHQGGRDECEPNRKMERQRLESPWIGLGQQFFGQLCLCLYIGSRCQRPSFRRR
jgi:hypothetical protein